jgi:predicted ATPase
MSTTMSAILDRAGGNPLYAEEFVRLLKDKSLLVRKAVYRSG